MPTSDRYEADPRILALGDAFYDVVEPAVFPKRQLLRNDRWARRVGLDGLDDDEWTRHFASFSPLPSNLEKPLALRYHGHQFDVYNPALGDGRGFLFAQLRDAHANHGRGRLLDLGTKGSGRTPWSRGGDGRLTLMGGVREILATEMLEALGVYTSKTFSLFETGESSRGHRTQRASLRAVDDRGLSLLEAAYALLDETRMGYDRFFFDWYGGEASERRALASPAATHYRRAAFDSFRKTLANHPPTNPERVDAPYFAAEPCTMLIDEVERIWKSIAECDDWSLLTAKVEAIRAMGCTFSQGPE